MILPFLLFSESVLPAQAFDLTLGSITTEQRFNWVSFALQTWVDQYERAYGQDRLNLNLGQDKEIVLAYLDRIGQIQALEKQIETAYIQRSPDENSQTTSEPSLLAQEQDLADLRAVHEATTNEVEQILAAQVSQVILAEGFGQDGELWPPLTFRFTDLPTLLIISPRDKIEFFYGQFLLPSLSATGRSALETQTEAELDVSALVDNVGGIAFWPALVTNRASLRGFLDTIAHEWAHNYLVFYPLGRRYFNGRELMTINETVASIFGEEIATLTLAKYYPEFLPPPSPSPQPSLPTPTPDPDAPETFGQAMRRIRLQVDEMLAEGKVEEAEAFMELERQKLVERGYRLRKLNQAYFAFRGSYAVSPGAVDPIGPWLRQLRAEKESLKIFMDQAAEITSLADLLEKVDVEQ